LSLTGELLRNRLRRDVVDRAGDALDVVFALLEQGQQLFVVHADLLGEFVYADAHSVCVVLAILKGYIVNIHLATRAII